MNCLTAALITLNEERDLPRVLASLADVPDEILVVDSGSTDHTCQIARRQGARVFSRPLTDYAEQRNFAASQATHDWILAIDADEELSPELLQSLRAWKLQPPAAAAYEFARKTRFLGRWIHHSGWYPDRKARLYRRDRARFAGRVHESLEVEGPVERLKGDLYHYTANTFAEQIAKVDIYSTLVAEQFFAAGGRRWRLAIVLGPAWAFLHKFFLQAGFLDGYRGWLIARMTARSVYLKYRKLGILVRRGSVGIQE